MEKGLTQKIYLELVPPTEDENRAYAERVIEGLHDKWCHCDEPEHFEENIELSLKVLRKLYPICDQAEWKVTISLAYTGHLWEIVDIEKGDTTDKHYGLAVDLGSTTVVMQLIDCNSGKVICQESVYNHQIRHGEDILSRIFYCKDKPEHIEEMRMLTVDSFVECMDAIKKTCGIDPRRAISMVAAGNTTMTHFLIGLEAFGVFSSPYSTQTLRPGFYRAADMDIPLPGYVYCYPSRANYLGGDIISGMIATDVYEKDDITLFFDVGTNGELVIGNHQFLLCGAGAAGPALEGGSVVTGMRAAKGAVQGVKLKDGDFLLDVIGVNDDSFEDFSKRPGIVKGICGSGIVEIISELFMEGWLDIRGLFVPDRSEKIVYIEHNTEDREGGEYAVEYAPGLYFYQCDVEEFIRTKSAAFTMIDYILSEAGIGLSDVSDFYMAGAFGTHVDKEAAINIGMYPDVEHERIHRAGNSSLAGAAKLLLDRGVLQKLSEILTLMSYVQFGEVDNFVTRMHAAQALPHTNTQMYPSVMKRLKERGTIQ